MVSPVPIRQSCKSDPVTTVSVSTSKRAMVSIFENKHRQKSIQIRIHMHQYPMGFVSCVTSDFDEIALPESKYGIDYSINAWKENVSTILSPSPPPTFAKWKTGAYNRGHFGKGKRLPLRARNSSSTASRAENGHSSVYNLPNVAPSPPLAMIKKRPSCKSPFEFALEDLTEVVRRKEYPEGTALLYIREIFEPSDPEFSYLPSNINVFQITREQVDRLRIMIVPKRREECLIAYLNYYETINKESHVIRSSSSSSSASSRRNDVQRHFDGFKRRYSTTRDAKEKLDLIFAFSFAIQKYGGFWMYRRERRLHRAKMVAGLARHWRHLIRKHDPEELGLDREYSYPAVMHFLRAFKEQVESLEVDSREAEIKFNYEVRYTETDDHCKFEEGSISSSSSRA